MILLRFLMVVLQVDRKKMLFRDNKPVQELMMMMMHIL